MNAKTSHDAAIHQFEPSAPPMLRLYSVSEAAVLLGVSRSWVDQQKVIPHVRIGRRKLYRQEDLTAFIDSNIRGGRKGSHQKRA
jgi:excisionase family DNA binding protein